MAERSALDGWIDSGAGWRLFPHLIVRTTGFAFDVLERLRYTEAGRAAAEIATHEVTLEGLRADGPRLRMPPRAVLAALRAGRPVPEGHSEDPAAFADWNAAANALLQARARLEKAVAEEGPRTQQALRALVQEPRFSEAIACSSPPVFEDIARARWNNRLDRQLASYAQRLCAKNETMGFFGPINYGLAAPERHNGVHLTWPGPEPLSGRKTYLASWAVQAIWQRIAFEPDIAPWLVLRRKAFFEMPAPREPNPDDPLPRLVKEADGSRTLSSLAQALELDLPATVELAKLGCRKGLLTHQLEIPSAAPHPLDDLAMRLAGIPGPGAQRSLGQLDDLRVLMRRYGSASAAEKVSLNERVAKLVAERWQAAPPTARASGDEAERRGSGHNFYVDRLPLREECGGKLELRIEGERARELATRCARALDLMGLAALRTRELARAEVARALGERSVPFWKLVAALGDRAPVRDRAVEEAIRAAITDPSAREVSLGALTLPESPACPLPQITSVDLLVDAPDVEAWARGDYRLVMGDVHDTALVWGWALQFHPEAGQVEAQMAAGLGALAPALSGGDHLAGASHRVAPGRAARRGGGAGRCERPSLGVARAVRRPVRGGKGRHSSPDVATPAERSVPAQWRAGEPAAHRVRAAAHPSGPGRPGGAHAQAADRWRGGPARAVDALE